MEQYGRILKKSAGTGKNTGTFLEKIRAPAILLHNSCFF
jgi:hypothetical protein